MTDLSAFAELIPADHGFVRDLDPPLRLLLRAVFLAPAAPTTTSTPTTG